MWSKKHLFFLWRIKTWAFSPLVWGIAISNLLFSLYSRTFPTAQSARPADGSDNVFVPSVSLYYKVTDAVDVNASLLYASGKDTDEELGDTSATLIRLGLGARYWLDTGTRFIPYVGGGIAFAMLDGDTDRTRVDDEVVGARVSVDNVPGGYLEGGASFMLADQLHFTAGLSWDFQFTSDATINGRDEDFSVRVLSLNIGVKWAF